ncbi:monosaccharide ABC transporter membrane protein, CUT2 family [Quadrisphaera granulorum]|uniref:Monosaccharide ABC transporter membrane protein (CUT2 family) n=1 Tax=Quadrisphaera granulorum TaxID=317664 RepID=A0A316AB06_9ACTN|nr:ABC transporter permease [Quadrisphaera granulorum]PWJ54180.1 monosaccharide ABC transporter membrane protein (CUT2 family) [Quadrisphaera granulorum]SZE96319.1 monosaccharide ABC transporter membrane protein, CUT2 family [Quadrisphaera granulorum]
MSSNSLTRASSTETGTAAEAGVAVPTRTPARLQFTTVAAARSIVPLLVVVVVLSWVTGSQNPAFLTSVNAQNVLAQVAVLGILAVGQTFLVVGGQIDLSVGSLVSLVGVVAARCFADGWSTPAVVVLALAIGAATGLVWGTAVALLDVPPFILTLGGLSVLGSLALVLSDNTPVPVRDGLSSWGFGTWGPLRTPVAMLLLVVVLGALLLHFTRFGRTTFALGSSRSTTFLAGVPVKRHLVLLYVGNSTLAAFAGLLMMARIASGDPRAGLGLELSVIAVVVLGGATLAGGRGTVVGTFAGVLVLGVVSASLTFLQVPGAFQSLVSGGILVLAVVATALAERRAGGSGTAGWAGALRRSLPRLKRT